MQYKSNNWCTFFNVLYFFSICVTIAVIGRCITVKIGIDIDGVILNTENQIRVNAEIYDLLELKKDGITNKNGFYTSQRYENWTKEELDYFREKYFIKSTDQAYLMPGAREIINLLKEVGHELIVITARGFTVKGMRKAGEKKLEELDLKFDKYFWATEDKVSVCKNENIDIMIDDNPNHCKAISENKIRTLYFRDVTREKLEENEYLTEVNNWGEVYRYIYNLNLKEK